MRRQCIVCYDIADPKRLARVAKTVEDFGTRVQFSVFLCELADIDRVKLRERLRVIINHDEDRVLFIDLGPLHRSGQLPGSVETLGKRPELPDTRNLIL